MIKKKMTPSVKTIMVECKTKLSTDLKEFNIDSEIFDDVHLEAATQFVESHIKTTSKIAPVLSTFEKKHTTNYDEHFCFNSYFIIINAGFHTKAETMRKNFMKQSGVDLRNESVKSKHGK